VAIPVDHEALSVRAWIQVVTTQSVVASGITSLLEGSHGDLVITFEGPLGGEPDVVFFDVIGLHDGDGTDLDHWVSHTSSIVIAVTRDLRPDLGAEAFERGAAGAISIGASAADFLEVVEAALTGHLADSRVAVEAEEGTRVGSEAGLTRREADVLGMIVRGLSNRDIGEAAGLSINSVKSYIRSAYRKMDVTSRSQAVKWGVQHGFPLDGD
jgi:DNA-binding NarL/FixJ family response regulator